jgi:hypothetical protein
MGKLKDPSPLGYPGAQRFAGVFAAAPSTKPTASGLDIS